MKTVCKSLKSNILKIMMQLLNDHLMGFISGLLKSNCSLTKCSPCKHNEQCKKSPSEKKAETMNIKQ